MEMIKKIVTLIDEKKGLQIAAMDVQGISPITDYLVIASAETVKQTQALADHVMKRLKEENSLICRHLDGYDNGEWIIMDYFDFLVHLFTPEKRELYDLDHLYGGGRKVEAHD